MATKAEQLIEQTQREDKQHAEQVLEDRRSGADHEQADAWAYDEPAPGPRR